MIGLRTLAILTGTTSAGAGVMVMLAGSHYWQLALVGAVLVLIGEVGILLGASWGE